MKHALKLSLPVTALVFAILLNACAHAPGGFLAKRTENSYDLFVGGAVQDQENAFYAGAYFTCLNNHDKGFEVKTRSSDAYGSIDATIVCTGKPDKYLGNKYSNRSIRVEKSSIRYADGFAYRIISDTQE